CPYGGEDVQAVATRYQDCLPRQAGSVTARKQEPMAGRRGRAVEAVENLVGGGDVAIEGEGGRN
ncbi:MAG TPA: hypothetical protein VGG16_01295, partial [Streptosporangiaceae bacterium]